MSPIPAGLSTENAPPMSVPLGHFLVGFGFLLGAGVAAGYVTITGRPMAGVVHLLLAGWVGITILGALTLFVVVWSSVDLHNDWLARWQLWPVAVGVPAVAFGMTTGNSRLLLVGGIVATVGFWLFVYNVGRTLATAAPFDVTEMHFAWALAFFLLATASGLTLAATYAGLLSPPMPVENLRAAHATLAVFGALLTTVFGALYQLVTIFTGSDLRGIERHLRTVETYGYPVGVLALAAGRLLSAPLLGYAGATVVLAGFVAIGVVLVRRVFESRHGLTPMLRRYLLVAVGLFGFVTLTAPAWLYTPIDPVTTFGPPGVDRLLWLGVIALVVVGSLYHIIPFIVWIDRYSDRVGYEPVPMVDELYDERLARADAVFLSAGILLAVAAEWTALAGVGAAALGLLSLGGLTFLANMAIVLAVHGPSVPSLLSGIRPV